MSGRRFAVAGFVLLLVAVGCTGGDGEPVDTAGAEAPAPATATTASPSPTPTPRPEGETLTVVSADDSGPGTLRQLLTDAQPGDTIVFDAAVFPPDEPQMISVESALPQIEHGYLTIDASDAGVILDGSRLPDDSWDPGLEIVSDHNTVRGLQVVNFTGTGIVVAFGGRNNTIGGDRSVGRGPVGQGNLTAGNDFGIGVWDRATDNVVTGNLIGTDVNGAPGVVNRTHGIWVDAATDNVIGPDNVIASSGRCGIQVEGGSAGTTITQNSIRDNAGAAICTTSGQPVAPLVNDLDVTGGRVTGTACGDCSVEIFSDAGDEGATYEGEAIADSNGAFTFDKAGGFADANVTLTATDPDGSTSRFSRPVGPTTVLTLQQGNRQPKSPLQAKRSGDLADNRIGTDVYAAGLWREIVYASESIRGDVLDLGAKRLHTSLFEVEPPIDWDGSEFEIPAEYDRLIDGVIENGVVVNYLLHFWDKEGHARGETLSAPRFTTQQQIDDFLEHIRFIVGHFKGRVDYYTLWSEPDNCGQGGIKCIEPHDYIELARQAIPVIREVDPQAKVAIAPVVLFFERGFLPTVLRSDVGPMFDVIQWHGQYNVTPDDPYYRSYDYYYDYRSIIEGIRRIGTEHGFQGEYWSTEMGWCAEEEDPHCRNPDHPWGILETDKQVAKYYARGAVTHLGMDVDADVGGLDRNDKNWSYPTIQYLNTIMAGAMPTSLDVDISGEATSARIQSYGFELSGGDTLFAVWTDGVAVDEDPGLNATLTFPGVSANRVDVTGLDVLHGFEQELMTGTAGGDLVIRDLLVRDYPTILRIHPS